MVFRFVLFGTKKRTSAELGTQIRGKSVEWRRGFYGAGNRFVPVLEAPMRLPTHREPNAVFLMLFHFAAGGFTDLLQASYSEF